MTTFNDWVMQAKVTNDPVGDFIDDTQVVIRANRRPPPIIESKEELERYLRIRNACPEAIKTIPAVWKRFQRWRIYNEIKTRALELFQSEYGFNGHSREEILSWKKSEWGLFLNSVGVAVCVARDEVYAALNDGSMSIEQRAYAIRNLQFTKADFRKVEAEIIKTLNRRR